AGQARSRRESEIGKILDVQGPAVAIRIKQNQARQLYWIFTGALHLVLVKFRDFGCQEADILVSTFNRRLFGSGGFSGSTSRSCMACLHLRAQLLQALAQLFDLPAGVRELRARLL